MKTVLILFFFIVPALRAQNIFERPQLIAGFHHSFKAGDDGWVGGFLFHIKKTDVTLQAGYRTVAPLTLSGGIKFGYPLIDRSNWRCLGMTRLSWFFRPDYILFDSQYYKQTLGIQVQRGLIGRIIGSIEVLPFGFYYGTRKDHQNFGTPKSLEKAEVNLLIAFGF